MKDEGFKCSRCRGGDGERESKSESGGWDETVEDDREGERKREIGGEREGEKRSEREAVIAISNRERDKIVIDFI